MPKPSDLIEAILNDCLVKDEKGRPAVARDAAPQMALLTLVLAYEMQIEANDLHALIEGW